MWAEDEQLLDADVSNKHKRSQCSYSNGTKSLNIEVVVLIVVEVLVADVVVNEVVLKV